MDVPRAPQPRRRKYFPAFAALGAILLVTLGLSRLEPPAPAVDRESVVVDSVRRGVMVREVRGPGTLVPEQIRWISALTPARVERILVQPGTRVEPSTVLLELSNPDVQIEALEAQRQLTAAEAELVNLRTTLENQRLVQTGVVAEMRSGYLEAQRQAEVAESLGPSGAVSRNDVSLARDKVTELATRFRVEQRRLALFDAAVDSQLAVQRAQVSRLRAISAFQTSRVRSLEVRAGEEGVLQELSLQLGQWVVPGALLAKVVQPTRLKAVLRIPETQVRDVALGQAAAIDTRNGIIPGRVVRIDPAAQGGTFTIDVALDGPLPPGARPEISVDGTITLERVPNALFVTRPPYGQAQSTTSLFKLIDGGRYAVRVPVQLGRTSVTTVEVLQGLQAGDRVIVSDMSRWDGVERVRLR
ncbi:MAG TPA: HlyD family efflux transporter periplasmic adaptor subunit [Gemmatimonadales bacterium]|jgi:multidrug resistance efflux pump|nr:HlyD family efflux transporter periplasmic adaptor subunit [Gemmatimonadales bacterium]